ncbi:MAG: TolC family protein [Gammaproteobacteria bacterium]
MSLLRITASLACVLSLLGVPFVATRAADSAVLSLAQAITIAQRDNKDLQAARHSVAIARARLQQAGARPNPNLNFSETSGAAFGRSSDYNASIGISQAFPIAGRIARQQAVSRVDVVLAGAEIQQNENALARDVANAFYRLLILDRQIAVRDALLETTTRLVTATRQRLQVAEAAEVDLSSAQLERARLVQERAQLQQQRFVQLAALNQLLARPSAQPLTPLDTVPEAAQLPSLGTQQQQALHRRPELRSAALRIDRAQAEQALAHAERWEDWTVGVNVAQSHQVLDGVGPQGTDRSVGISLSIPLPLSSRTRGRLAEAGAAKAQASAQTEALRFNIENEIVSRRSELERLQAELQNYRQTLLPLAARTQSLTAQAYQQGQAPLQNLVLAQQQSAALRSAYLDTLEQFLQTWVALQTATGDYLESPQTNDTALPNGSDSTP